MSFSLRHPTHTKLFWFILTFCSIACFIFAYKFFSRAFPIVDLNIKMDRQTALQSARSLSTQFSWGPQPYQEAASFEVDSETQFFIELEGGGSSTFAEILAANYYAPYYWSVRHFKEFDAQETTIYFKPDGTPYGFTQKIPEDLFLPSLTSDQARSFAQEQAQQFWSTDFTLYKEVEASQQEQPNGRIDHTFVYERVDKKVGDAPFRLSLVMSGNQFTQYKLSVQVPEAFTRRYKQMRSYNNTLAHIAGILVLLCYLLGCCSFGYYILMRHRAFIWRPALWWAGIVTGFHLAQAISAFPLLWINYDTKYSVISIVLLFIMRLIAQGVLEFIGLTFVFALAEGLTRLAFPQQPQLWKLWSKTALQSWQVIGRTIGGYLTVGFHIAFCVAFYYIAHRFLQWWSPSEALYDPNTLAHYLPWIAPLASSLGAGFMEECVFRALPLATAALLGDRYKKRTLFIAVAFILQAIIFGAAHANYPAQPAFARLVELLVPSFIFGGIYLLFGLFTSIIAHFAYDVIWFSLPIFIATSPGIWIDKFLIIVGTFIPFIIILAIYLRRKEIITLPMLFYNKSWQPSSVSEKVEQPFEILLTPAFSRKKIIVIVIAGTVGLISWIGFSKFSYDAIPVNTRQEMMPAAISALQQLPEDLASWNLLSSVETDLQDHEQEQHVFIWRTANPTTYRSLLGTYLTPPAWYVRLVHFEGDVAQRAHEYTLQIINQQKQPLLRRITQQLPEAQPGATLSPSEVRNKAYQLINDLYQLNETNLKEISMVSQKRPERIDWVITFSTPSTLTQGEERIAISFAGDHVVDVNRFIFVPETWSRTYKNYQMIYNLITTICRMILIFLLLAYIALFFKQLITTSYAWNFAALMVIIIIIKAFINGFNIWPMALYSFNTTSPYAHQLFFTVTQWIIQSLAKILLLGYLAGILPTLYYYVHIKDQSTTKQLLTGISIGCCIMGLHALMWYIQPQLSPRWPDYSAAGAYYPWLTIVLNTITDFIKDSFLALFFWFMLDHFSKGWKKYQLLISCLLPFVTVLYIGSLSIDSIPWWLLHGFSLGLLLTFIYITIIRFDRTAIPYIIATIVSLELLHQLIFNAVPGIVLATIISIPLIMLCAWWLSAEIDKKRK